MCIVRNKNTELYSKCNETKHMWWILTSSFFIANVINIGEIYLARWYKMMRLIHQKLSVLSISFGTAGSLEIKKQDNVVS